MPLLVVGSIALDSVETSYGKAEDCLGGSAVYFSYGPCPFFFSNVRLVEVIGKDFSTQFKEVLPEEKH